MKTGTGLIRDTLDRFGFSFRLLGLGFWQAWWLLAMNSGLILPPRSTFGEVLNPFFCVTITTTLGYLVVVLISKWKAPFSSSRWSYLLAGACAALGSFGLSLFSFIPNPGDYVALYVLFAVIFSAGNALLLIMWGELWSTLATGRVGRYLYVSYLFAFILYFVITLLPHAIAICVTCLLPAISVIVLYFSQNEPKRSPSQIDYDIGAFSPLKIGVAIIAVGAIHGFVQTFLNTEPTASLSLMSSSLLVAGVILLALVLNMVISHPAVEPISLYRPIVPAFVCGLILLVILPPDYMYVGNGLMLLGIYSLDMLLMLVSTDIAFRTRKPVAFCFGLVILGTRLGTTIASSGVYLGRAYDWFTPDSANIIFLLCAAIIVIIGSLVFTQVDLQKLYIPRAAVRANESIKDSCQNLAETCGLTPRETEVLELLATGRSAPYISERLVIAQSTVKNHISSIYRKIGVYDRQSLVDVVLTGTAGKGALPFGAKGRE